MLRRTHYTFAALNTHHYLLHLVHVVVQFTVLCHAGHLFQIHHKVGFPVSCHGVYHRLDSAQGGGDRLTTPPRRGECLEEDKMQMFIL